MVDVIHTSGQKKELACLALAKAFKFSLDYAAKCKRIAIYGASDTTKFILNMFAEHNLQVQVILDDYEQATCLNNIPVMPVLDGLRQFVPDAVILGTVSSQDRMHSNLLSAGFQGRILAVRDPWSYCRSVHNLYLVSPTERLEPFRNRHINQRAFIVGSGPSLLKTDPRRLQGELVFACNNIFLLENFIPTYYMVMDQRVACDRASTINELIWEKFFPSTVSEWITNGIFIHALRTEWPSNFSTDMTKWLETGFTVIYSLLQLAFFMGCNPVYLIGVDHTYKISAKQSHQDGAVLTAIDDDPNHFHPDYSGPGYRWYKPDFEKMTAAFQVAKSVYEAHGRDLFNATAGGALEELPRVDFETIPGIPK